jgi:hypothetical protein
MRILPRISSVLFCLGVQIGITDPIIDAADAALR